MNDNFEVPDVVGKGNSPSRAGSEFHVVRKRDFDEAPFSYSSPVHPFQNTIARQYT
ncbi:MAG: hypothetical protein LBS44_04965 [Deltaproteobacteria bacterium]|jgi:hypothetical protein|nr:hypothetical protein [Deltaproteobacteria bacterium]